MLTLLLFAKAKGQDFRFFPDGDTRTFYSGDIKTNGGSNTSYNDVLGMATAHEWIYMVANSTTWQNKYLFKSVVNMIRVGVDHNTRADQASYKYKIILQVTGYSNPGNPTSGVTLPPYEFEVEYRKNALAAYKDLDVLRLPANGFYAFQVRLLDVFDISGSTPVPVSRNDLAENFKIEAEVITQRYDTDDGTMKDVFINSQFNAATQSLDVYWAHVPQADHRNTPPGYLPMFDVFKPVKYELEWLYIDDYVLNSNGTKGYRFTGSSYTIPYDFRSNSTRVQTHQNYYSIPMVYGHGAVIFRLRQVRPSSINFSETVYYPWNMPETGTLTPGQFYSNGNNLAWGSPYIRPSNCLFINETPFINDSLNWQYTVSFAEEGKYKHVVNYFDGMGKNRQTQTKINTDDNYVIGVDNIYDFEGRPAITTLPVPVLSRNIRYKPDLSLNAATGQPYRAADFDGGCGTDSIAPLAAQALANIYYSPLNPDKAGMQQFVPDAEGYPLIETRYAADYTDKVQWQGGAGLEFQRWKGRGTQYVYSRAGQRELNRLFGSEAGYASYYPKQTIIDPNGQASFSITDASGKVVATGLSGTAPDSALYPLEALSSLPEATYRESDVLKDLPQETGLSFRNAQVNYFNEALSRNSLKYKLGIPPFPACDDQFIRVEGQYRITLFDECNTQTAITMTGTVGSNGISAQAGTDHFESVRDSAQLVPGKYTIQKELTFSDSAIVHLASGFVESNSGDGLCYEGKEPFIRKEIEQSTFPCEPGEDGNDCDALKRQMMQELYPGAKYGRYISNADGSFSAGAANSIFTMIVAPLDTNWVLTTNPQPGDICKYSIREIRREWVPTPGGNETINYKTGYCKPLEDYLHTITAPYPYQIYNTSNVDCPPSYFIMADSPVCSTRVTSIPETKCLYEVIYLGRGNFTYTCNGQSVTIPVIGAHTEYIWATDTADIPNTRDVPPGIQGQLCNQTMNLPWVTGYKHINPEPIECIYYIPPHYRYQSACLGDNITIPVKKVSVTGTTYTTNTLLKDVTPDMLIASFNDEIAEKLLPLHPEYCKLQACDSSKFESILSGIESYDEAAALGMHTLQGVLSKDPLSQANPNAPNAPFTAAELSHFAMDANLTGPNANLLRRLDTMALVQAYCGSNAPEATWHCQVVTHAADINLMNLSDPVIKELYVRSLKALYLANRSTRKQLFTDATGNNCAPCDTQRMELTGSPVFPNVFNPAGQFVVDSVPQYIKTAVNNYLNNPTTTIPQVIQDELNQMGNNGQCNDQITAIMQDLEPCLGQSNTGFWIAYDLTTYCHNYGIDQLSPAVLRSILVTRLGGISDLCQPFLTRYKLYEPDVAAEGDYVSEPGALYEDFRTLLNRTEVKNAVLKSQPSGSPQEAFSLDPANTFEAALAAKLGIGTAAPVNVRGYIENVDLGSGFVTVVKVTVASGSNAEHIYLAPRSVAASAFPNPFANLNFNTVYSVLDEMPVVEGGIADKLAYVTLRVTVPPGIVPTFPDPLAYSVWTSSIPLLKLKDKAGVEDCINCEQLRRAVAAFQADTAFYSLPADVKHPLFFRTLKNHLNYTLGATQNESAYRDMLEGCAMSDRFNFKNAPAVIEFSLASGGANNFGHAMNRVRSIRDRFQDLSIPYYAFRRPSGEVRLRIDLNSVPKDSLVIVKQFIMGLSGSPVYMPAGYDAELFRSGTGTPVIAGASVSHERVKYLLPDGAVTEVFWFQITANNQSVNTINKVMTSVANYVARDTIGAYQQIHYGYAVFRSPDYRSIEKRDYLDYVYGMSTESDPVLADALSPVAVKNAVSTLNAPGLKLSYNNPWKENDKQHLYYWDTVQSNAGFTRLQTTLNQVKNTLSGNKLFPAAAAVNISGSPGVQNASVKAFRLANGNAWYRVFDAQNKLYNIYLVPSERMTAPAEEYAMVSAAPAIRLGEGDSAIYRFNITMKKGSHEVIVEGYTDFPIGTGGMIRNVVLSKNGNPKGRIIDTATCERGIMEVAVAQGMQQYYAYKDALKEGLRYAMRKHFAANTADTLILGTREQQYHYTLYYYDRAGNLTKTVPPQGVNAMPDASQGAIDHARNSVATGVNLTQKAVHNKPSLYKYNSQNLLIWQQTPDGGETEFFYDLAGRLAFSQNAQQRTDGKFTYTLYDNQGRIEETGVLDATRPQVTSYAEMAVTSGSSPYASWVKGKTRTEVVATRYDEPLLVLGGYDMLSDQQNLRKRVSAVLYSPSVTTQQSINEYYHFATHFSYDAMGNVSMLVHDNPYLNYLQQRFKRIDYDYDLLSGKVNMLSYNRGHADQYYQRYDYDADNRITGAESSRDGLHWDRDAAYTYYKHGPLAEVQLGDLNVQGVQYAYTIQGWLKAINGDVLNPQEDMGRNGLAGSVYPADVIAHALDYYQGDYKAIDQAKAVTHAPSLPKSLYNGNIARQTTAVSGMDNLIRDYRYDQLHRITSATYSAYDNMSYAVTDLANAYKNTYSYDADGNLQALKRFNGQAAETDNFSYHYTDAVHHNKLSYVQDAAVPTGAGDLQPGQSADNYTYDAIGNLKTDRQEGIKAISWNSYGKMSRLTKGTDQDDTLTMVFHYDGMGNRIRKDVWHQSPGSSGGVQDRVSDIYVRDAQGNILAVYKEQAKVNGGATIDWLNSQLSTVVAGPELAVFFAGQFGGNGTFTNNLYDYSLEQAPAWAAAQLSERPAGFYVIHSPDMYAHAMEEHLAASWSHILSIDPAEFVNLFIDKQGDINRTGRLLAVGLQSRNVGVPTLEKLCGEDNDFTGQLFYNLPGGYQTETPQAAIEMGAEKRIAHLSAVMEESGTDPVVEAFARASQAVQPDAFLSSWLYDDKIFNPANLSREYDIRTALKASITRSESQAAASMVREAFAEWMDSEAPAYMTANFTERDLLNVIFNSDREGFLERFLDGVGMEGITAGIVKVPGMNGLSYGNIITNAVGLGQLNPAILQYVNTPSPQNIETDTMWLAEHHLYGSSRLGIKKYEPHEYRNVYSNTQSFVKGINIRVPWYSRIADEEIRPAVKVIPLLPSHYLSDTSRYRRYLGTKYYELSDHLGNVLATVLDRKTGYGAANGQYAGFTADIASATDYYPFGMEMPGRTIDSMAYRFGFNTQEKVDEIAGKGNHNTALFWEYSPRIARRWNVDPVDQISISNYAVNSLNPISSNDPYGDCDKCRHSKYNLDYMSEVPATNDRTLANYGAALENGARDVINIIPSLWNSIVTNANYLYNGHWTSGMGEELTQTKESIKEVYNYTVNTPILEQLSDATLPGAVRSYTSTALTFGIGSVAGVAAKTSRFGTPKFGINTTMPKLGVNTSRPGLTNAQLIEKAAIKAEAAVGGSGRFAGTAKHTYATKLLERYQKVYGNRGLLLNDYFPDMGFGKGFLDVRDVTNGIIYDFKFGEPVMRTSQFNKYNNTFGLPIKIVDRFGNIISR